MARAIGHMEAVRRMMEEDKDPSEILIQLAAVRSAITGLSRRILQEHIETVLEESSVNPDNEEELEDLKKVGRPAILMCFVPATFEIVGMLLFAPILFGLPVMDSLVLGTVIAAVSPAVIVPHMLQIMEEGYGVQKGIPQMILAGASADDVFVIVLFTSFTGIALGGTFEAVSLIRIPSSILLGIAGGMGVGYALHRFLSRIELSIVKTLILFLSTSFLLVTLEDAMNGSLDFLGLSQ
jgi:NhaP-type Na+/H+ or K+/H+ antiporter